MTLQRILHALIGTTLLALAIAGCGESETKTGSNGTGAPPPIDTPVLAAGPIVGLEPLTIASASVEGGTLSLDTNPQAAVEQLRLGMGIEAAAVSRGGQISGQLLSSQSAARGVVSNVTLANSLEQRVTIAGVTFRVDHNTILDGVNSVGHIELGNWLEVHAMPNAGGLQLATRVTRIATPVSGLAEIVGRTNTLADGFSLEGVRVSVASLTASLPPLPPSSRIRVLGTYDATTNSISATRIDVLPRLTLQPGAQVYAEGIVQRYDTREQLVLQTPSADYTVNVPGGAPFATFVGSRVRVVGIGSVATQGSTSTTTIDATAVTTVIPGTSVVEYQLGGVVSDYESLARLRLRGELIDLSGAQFVAGSSAEVANGRRLRVVAIAGPGRLLAQRVQVL